MSALAGKDPSTADIKKILDSVDADYNEDDAAKLVSALEGKSIHEIINFRIGSCHDAHNQRKMLTVPSENDKNVNFPLGTEKML